MIGKAVALVALALSGCVCTEPTERVLEKASACREMGGEPMLIPVSKYQHGVRRVDCLLPGGS